MKGLSLLIVLLDACAYVYAVMRRMKKETGYALTQCLSFSFYPQRHSVNLIFNTNSMEMRQNSNEVKQKKRKEKKRNKNLRSGRQQIKFCCLLENWPLSFSLWKKKEFVLNAISCHIWAKKCSYWIKPKTQLPRTSGWIRKCARFSNEMKRKTKTEKEKRERKENNSIRTHTLYRWKSVHICII